MNSLLISIGNCGINIFKDIFCEDIELNSVNIQIQHKEKDAWESRLQEYSGQNFNSIILTCGLGGKTSKLLLEPVVKFIIDNNIMSEDGKMICLCTWPFQFEGESILVSAQATLDALRNYTDIVVVQYNDKLNGEDDMVKMNQPVVKAAKAAVSQSDKPLIYVLDAIMDSDSIDSSFNSHLSGSHIDIYVKDNRFKNMVNEALGIDTTVQSPDGVNLLMENFWQQRQGNQNSSNNIFKVLLPPL